MILGNGMLAEIRYYLRAIVGMLGGWLPLIASKAGLISNGRPPISECTHYYEPKHMELVSQTNRQYSLVTTIQQQKRLYGIKRTALQLWMTGYG
ncbi:hypothetical protein AVEN_266130-1 [Araneus ventricosus]|uniref:Uncharacterized protein n=1 Tax=Araneus ventricosus TaxID=182803 RepID=A0A4Y2GAH9_ARAVE|nr:hypothetical protein AVEN_266130-1 [Araneus ventricosus]